MFRTLRFLLVSLFIILLWTDANAQITILQSSTSRKMVFLEIGSTDHVTGQTGLITAQGVITATGGSTTTITSATSLPLGAYVTFASGTTTVALRNITCWVTTAGTTATVAQTGGGALPAAVANTDTFNYSTFIVLLSKNGGSLAPPVGTLSEVGKGQYYLTPNTADTGTVGPLWLHTEVSTGTSLDPNDREYNVVAFNPDSGTNLGLSALPTANPAAANGLPTVGTGAGQVNPDGTGAVPIAMGTTLPTSPTANTVGEALFGEDQRLGRRGTAQGGTSTTIQLDLGASATNQFYLGDLIKITGNTGSGQFATIINYVGSTQTATIARLGSLTGTWATTPDNTSTFQIYPVQMTNVAMWNGGQVNSLISGNVPANTQATASALTYNLTGNVTGNLSGSVGSVTGAVGSVTGNVGGNVTGSVGSISGITFPSNFSALLIGGTGHISNVDTLTTYTGNTPQSGDAYARLGAPAGASVSADIASVFSRIGLPAGASIAADIASIKTDTGTTIPGRLPAALVGGKMDSNISTYTSGEDPATLVLGATAASWNTAGTIGAKINAAGSAGDPWATLLPGSYASGTAGNIIGNNLNASITSRMASYTQPTGFLAATFPSGTIANQTNITAGTITTVTNLTNLPSIPSNWITSAGISANALNGKGDWLLSSSYPTNFSSLLISGTGHISNVDTLTTYTGNTPQTGDSFARIGAAGAGLTALGDSRIANLDTTVSSRMATFSLPSNFSALLISAGGHISNVDTLTTYTGNTPQTGDSFARIGVNGSGLTALGDNRLTFLTGDAFVRLGAPAGASVSADILTANTSLGTLTTRIPGIVQPQTGDSFARLGAPVGSTIDADISAVPASMLSTGFVTIQGTHTSTGTSEVLTLKQLLVLMDAELGGDNTQTVGLPGGTFTTTYYIRGQPKTSGNIVYVATTTLDSGGHYIGRSGLITQPFPTIP